MDLSYRIGRIFFKTISPFYFPTKVTGLENIPQSGNFILAANHLSNMDPFIIGTFCGRILNFVAKEELFRKRLLAMWITSLGAFPIRRDTADFRGLRETLRRLKKYPVLIFPEGTRVARNKKPQPGIGFIAARSGLPVIPLHIKGTDKVLPPGGKMLVRNHVTINFGRPIHFSAAEEYAEVADKIVQSIYSLQKHE